MLRPVVLLLLALPAPAFPWGTEGHKIVAYLALHFLSSDLQNQMNNLLALDPGSTPTEAATYPDVPCNQTSHLACRDDATGNNFWHFTDIPILAPAYDPARDCANQFGDGQCSVAQLSRLVGVLQDPTADPVEQARGLEFLLHIAGDLHQPLHSSNNDDHGANDVKLEFFGRCTITGGCMNLHRIWDTDLPRNSLGCGSTCSDAVLSDYADGLAASIGPDDIAQWSAGMPADWANEAHDAAIAVSYGALPQSCAQGGACSSCTGCTFQYVLADDYQAAAAPAIDLQLKRAGVRLATLLTQALQPPAPAF